jgi:hypothetical protein
MRIRAFCVATALIAPACSTLPVPPPQYDKLSAPRGILLPPKEYDHKYTGQLTIIRVNADDMQYACPRTPISVTTLGCAHVLAAECQIVMLHDNLIEAVGERPTAVLRHEIGHCNGWLGDHRGARLGD